MGGKVVIGIDFYEPLPAAKNRSCVGCHAWKKDGGWDKPLCDSFGRSDGPLCSGRGGVVVWGLKIWDAQSILNDLL